MSQRAKTISPSRSWTLNCVYTRQEGYPGKENLFGALFLLKHKTRCDWRHAFSTGLGRVGLPSIGGNDLSYAVGNLSYTSSRASTDCSFVMSSKPELREIKWFLPTLWAASSFKWWCPLLYRSFSFRRPHLWIVGLLMSGFFMVLFRKSFPGPVRSSLVPTFVCQIS